MKDNADRNAGTKHDGMADSRSVLRTVLGSVMVLGLILLAGCGGRPSAAEYEAYQVALQDSGLLRTETAPPDAPYDAADLVRNFERIALYYEVDLTKAGGEGNRSQTPLERWAGPLKYSMYGSAITAQDRFDTEQLMKRISRLTGLEITETRDSPNFLITITTRDERDGFSMVLARANPEVAKLFDVWRRTADFICFANNFYAEEGSGVLNFSLIVIGEETNGLMRKSCLHEEIVQAMGLPNDHPDVRPSIFNDDEEFALLTEHDEQLLRILYDPRLEPGMTVDEAMPIVRQIVAEIPLGQAQARVAVDQSESSASKAKVTTN